jgi:excisionase family DNA binding protein
MESTPLLRPEDVAERLAVSKVTVYRLARSGDLRSVRIRGQVRFRAEAVDDFLARAEGESPSAPLARARKIGRPRKQWVPSNAA